MNTNITKIDNFHIEDKQKQYILKLLREFKKFTSKQEKERNELREQIDTLWNFLSFSNREDDKYIKFKDAFYAIRFSGYTKIEDMLDEFENLYKTLQEVTFL